MLSLNDWFLHGNTIFLLKIYFGNDVGHRKLVQLAYAAYFRPLIPTCLVITFSTSLILLNTPIYSLDNELGLLILHDFQAKSWPFAGVSQSCGLLSIRSNIVFTWRNVLCIKSSLACNKKNWTLTDVTGRFWKFGSDGKLPGKVSAHLSVTGALEGGFHSSSVLWKTPTQNLSVCQFLSFE